MASQQLNRELCDQLERGDLRTSDIEAVKAELLKDIEILDKLIAIKAEIAYDEDADGYSVRKDGEETSVSSGRNSAVKSMLKL